MTHQLRIYEVKEGAMEDWLAEWRELVLPLRRKYGFEVLGAWTVEGTSRFVWIISHPGPGAFEEHDAEYYASPERAALDPDPIRHLEGAETRLMRSVLPVS